MATATKKVQGARPVSRGSRESALLEFRVYRDNGGEYHWEIVGDSGESLAQSGSFVSHGEAQRAVLYVYDGLESARLEPAEEPQPVGA